MRTAAILPVKRFTLAKQRLGASVADPLRRELAEAMVGDVLAALASCAEIECTIVVSNEQAIASVARQRGAILIGDSVEDGQSAAVTLGLERALADGIQRALCVPGDCPALDPEELRSLLSAAAERPGVVVIPDRHGTGTNGLLLTPPDAIGPSFGPDSCERHRKLAQAAGLACQIERPASLLLDIDTGADLAALRERLSGERVHAPLTRAVLSRAVHDGVGEPWPASPPAA
jgi:2-phospho-L-lactate/phosphoenolpyruvate guanylyltransferase